MCRLSLLYTILFFRALVYRVNGALNIYGNLIEDFIYKVHDHIYVDCNIVKPKSELMTSCNSLMPGTCRATFPEENVASRAHTALLHTRLLNPDLGATDLGESFSLVFIKHVQWLLHHINVFSQPNLPSYELFSPTKKKALDGLTENHTFHHSNGTTPALPWSTWLKWILDTLIEFGYKNRQSTGFHLATLLTPEKVPAISNQNSNFSTFQSSMNLTLSYTQTSNSLKKESVPHIMTLHVLAPLLPTRVLAEFYGSQNTKLSIRWVGEWQVINGPWPPTLGEQETLVSNLVSGSKRKAKTSKQCIEAIATRHAIVFSAPVVMTQLDATLLMGEKKAKGSVEPEQETTLLFIDGVVFDSKPSDGLWIYKVLPLIRLKSSAFRRVWTARIDPNDFSRHASINVMDYIIDGFRYSRIDAMVLTFSMRYTEMVPLAPQMEYLIMHQRSEAGMRFCIHSFHIRFLHSQSNSSLQPLVTTREKNEVGVVMIPSTRRHEAMIYPTFKFERLPSSFKNNLSQNRDRSDWLLYWGQYLKSQTGKRSTERAFQKPLPFFTLQDIIRLQFYNTIEPFLEITSEGVVINKDAKHVMAQVQFFRELNIPEEAPLCTLNQLWRNARALPLLASSETFIFSG